MAIADEAGGNWSGVWYPKTMQRVQSIAGPGDEDSNGQAMPALSAVDTVALLGVVTPGLILAIENFSVKQNGKPAEIAIVESRALDDRGVMTNFFSDLKYTDVKRYLSLGTDTEFLGTTSDAPWRRMDVLNQTLVTAGDEAAVSWQPYCINPVVDNLALEQRLETLGRVRTAIAHWQAMVNASASAMTTNAADVTMKAPSDALEEFLSNLRMLCADLDGLSVNTPSADYGDAVTKAIGEVSEFVGKAAAEIAEKAGDIAGKVAGNVLGGFLENAGLMAVLVVGIAIYVVVK